MSFDRFPFSSLVFPPCGSGSHFNRSAFKEVGVALLYLSLCRTGNGRVEIACGYPLLRQMRRQIADMTRMLWSGGVWRAQWFLGDRRRVGPLCPFIMSTSPSRFSGANCALSRPGGPTQSIRIPRVTESVAPSMPNLGTEMARRPQWARTNPSPPQPPTCHRNESELLP